MESLPLEIFYTIAQQKILGSEDIHNFTATCKTLRPYRQLMHKELLKSTVEEFQIYSYALEEEIPDSLKEIMYKYYQPNEYFELKDMLSTGTVRTLHIAIEKQKDTILGKCIIDFSVNFYTTIERFKMIFFLTDDKLSGKYTMDILVNDVLNYRYEAMYNFGTVRYEIRQDVLPENRVMFDYIDHETNTTTTKIFRNDVLVRHTIKDSKEMKTIVDGW